jgi:acyl-CoA thioesterase I
MPKLITALALLMASTLAAPARTVHIVAFGDSNTAGYLVAHDRAYPAQLQARLHTKGYDVAVSNAGISGDTTAGALARFDSAIGPDTDIAIVEFGINDLRRGISAATMRARLTQIIRTLKTRKIQVLLISSGPLKVADIARANGVLHAQWSVPKGQHRAGDGQHLNADGYAIVIGQMLPAIETMLARVTSTQRP